MMKKQQNLLHWLEYFGLLRTFEDKGQLEVLPEKHEAYITQPALYTLVPGAASLTDIHRLSLAIPKTLRRIFAYGGWKSQQGADYLRQPFAIHVVQEDESHGLLYTFLLFRRRAWWKLWLGEEIHIEIITY